MTTWYETEKSHDGKNSCQRCCDEAVDFLFFQTVVSLRLWPKDGARAEFVKSLERCILFKTRFRKTSCAHYIVEVKVQGHKVLVLGPWSLISQVLDLSERSQRFGCSDILCHRTLWLKVAAIVECRNSRWFVYKKLLVSAKLCRDFCSVSFSFFSFFLMFCCHFNSVSGSSCVAGWSYCLCISPDDSSRYFNSMEVSVWLWRSG